MCLRKLLGYTPPFRPPSHRFPIVLATLLFSSFGNIAAQNGEIRRQEKSGAEANVSQSSDIGRATRSTTSNKPIGTRKLLGSSYRSPVVPGDTLFPVASFEGEPNRMGFIDTMGRIVIPLRFHYVDNFSEGLAVIKLEERGKEGFTDTLGNIAIQPQFDRAFPFMNGRAKVRIDGKWGFINSSGDVVIAPAFDEADNFSEGLAAIKLNGKWGYVDLTGKLAIPPRFQRANRFSEGVACVTSNNQLGYIDKSGKWFLTPRFEVPPSPTAALRVTNFNSARAVARKGDQYGFIDKTGAFIIPAYFDKADIFSEELASVTIQNKAGYINSLGTLVISLRFDAARQFSEGYAAVLVGNKWGYVDSSGSFAIEPQFDNVMPFKGGLAWVTVGRSTGYVNARGRFVWPESLREDTGTSSRTTPSREEPDQKTAGLITSLQRGSFEEVSRAIHALHASGKKAIPSLIESISKDHYVANLFKDPTSSYIQNGSLSQFAGVRSAYVIELILASDKLPSTKVKKTSFELGPQPQNYLYGQAVIVKGATQPISRQDLLTVKDIYQQWWEGNKGKSIDALRSSWRVGDRPLKGQDFSWDGSGPGSAPLSSNEQTADSQDIAELVQKAVNLPFPSRAEEMRQQLTHLGGSAAPFIAESIRNNARMNPIKKAFLVEVIASIPSDESQALRTLLTDKDPHVRGLSVEYLGKRRARVAIPDLVALLEDRAIYFMTFRTDPPQEERTLVRDVVIASLESVTGLIMSPHASKDQQAQEWIRWWHSQQKAQSVTK